MNVLESAFTGAPPLYVLEKLKEHLKVKYPGQNIEKRIENQWKKISDIRSGRGTMYDNKSIMHYL